MGLGDIVEDNKPDANENEITPGDAVKGVWSDTKPCPVCGEEGELNDNGLYECDNVFCLKDRYTHSTIQFYNYEEPWDDKNRLD
jgi:hypothetical protein